MTRQTLLPLVLIAGLNPSTFADEPDPSPTKVTLPGLTREGSVLLPNGWSLKPAGKQTRLGDLPVLIAVHPTEPVLAVLHAGYGEHEVMTVNANDGKVIGRVALAETFSGLVWSKDGRRLFAGGGWDDVVYGFDYAAGLLSNQVKMSFPEPLKGGGRRGVAGLAISDDGKTLWAANVFGHTVARFDTEGQGKLVGEWNTGADTFPYGLVLDEKRHRLYVSLWNASKVAVIDTETGKVVHSIATEAHPNEMLLARGGKVLYVANANRNTVSVCDTNAGKSVEVIG